jgi:alkylation response protein AidB-like acyl-CoA dehydrogenase
MSARHVLLPGAAPETQALADSARKVLADLHSDQMPQQAVARHWPLFAELGWLGACLPEAVGGSGLPLSAWSVLAETLAPALMTEPLLSQLALTGYVLSRADADDARDALLTRWLAGETRPALVSATPAVLQSEGGRNPFRCEGVGSESVLHGQQPGVADVAGCDALLIPAHDAAGPALFLLSAESPGVRLVDHAAIDGRVHWDVELRAAPWQARLNYRGTPTEALTEAGWLHALLLASESLGLMRELTRRTQHYLLQREQFGRKLIEFQALQHRLVDMLLQVTRVEGLLEVARLQVDVAGLAAAAPFIAAAKAGAGEEGRRLGREAVQLHGAIGVTDELMIGQMLKRLVSNELLGGTTAMHADYWERHRLGA